MSTVIYLENGLCPQNRRVLQLDGSIQELSPDWQTPFVAFIDGEPVLRADWNLTPTDEQVLTFIDADAIPQGGGGGGSSPLRTVLMLAVMVYAPTLAQNALFGGGINAAAALGSTGLSIFNAGAMFAGMALVNAIAPPPKPTTPQQAAAIAAASPTYSLQAQGNTARLEAAIPEHFGRHIVYPDFAANPYTEYAGNEQYLYQLLCVGRGSYDLETLKIEDTPISSFDEITTEVIQPYGQVTLFPAAVTTSIEVAGQTLSPTAVGPFVANAEQTLVNKLAFDFVASSGMYYANDNGSLATRSVYITIEIATVDDYGNLTGAWTTLDSDREFTAATTTAQRWSWVYFVPSGRYTARVKRSEDESTSTRVKDSVSWAGLRAYHPDADGKNYGDVTLVAIRMKATDNLSSQASRKFNVIATRKLPIWNGTSWSALTATRNPAWALAYAAKQVGQSDASIDLPGLLTLANGCASRGDNFDARFDSFLSFWEAATKICGSVRAKPFIQGSVLRVVRDQASSIPVAMFSQRNIVKGSFSVNYLMPTEDTADSVDVSYFDEITWKDAKVRSTLAGSTADKPAKVDLFGVINRRKAWQEGLYQAACNRYRRKMITFKTEMEGFIPSFLDLATVQHDMPAWGQSGEVVAWNSSTKTLTLSEPPVFATGTHYIALRDRGGVPRGPYTCVLGSSSYEVVLSELPAFTPYVGMDEERTHFAFGPGIAWSQPVRILTVKPTSFNQVEITAVNEDASVHTADGGITMPVQQFSQLAAQVNAPVVGTVRALPTVYGTTLTIDWEPVAWTVDYIVQQSDDSGNTWFDLGTTEASSWVSPVPFFSSSLIRVAAQGALARGPWSTAEILANASPDPTTPSATVTAGDRSIRVSWLFGDLRQDIFGTEVWVSPTNDRSSAILRSTVPYPNQSYEYVGISPGAGGYFWVRVRDTHGGVSAWFPESATGGMYTEALGEEGAKDLTPPPTPTGFAASAAISNLLVECDAPSYTQGHAHAKSRLYGATWTSGSLPVFADAVVLTEFSGTVTSHATDPGTIWHLWLKWVTVDGVESTSPAGGTNGVVAHTGEDVTALVEAMTGPGNPFTVLDVETVIDGVTFPAGTYSTRAFVQDLQVTTAKIKELDLDSGRVSKLSVAKLKAGSLAVGEYIQSDGYTEGAGGQGYRLSRASAVLPATSIRGQLVAEQIDSRGLSIKDAAGNVIVSAGSSIAGSVLNIPGTVNNTPAGWLNSSVSLGANGVLSGAGGGTVTLPGIGLKTYRVISRGFSSTTHPGNSGIYDVSTGTQLYAGGVMYSVVKINRATGVSTFVGQYNTLAGGSQPGNMAAALNAINNDHIVIVLTNDEPQANRLLGGLPEAMYRHGASRAVFGSSNFRARGAYVLIGIGACGEGNGAEAYQGTVDSDPNAWVDVSFSVVNGNLTGVSAASTPKTLSDYGYVGDLDATHGATATEAAAIAAANSGLASKLSKSGADTMVGPISLTAATAILVGNTTNGLYLGNTGIVGRKNGVTTFSVDQAGNATFRGDISGATGTFAGNVHGGQFTTGAYTGYGWPAAGYYGSYLGPSGLLLGNANNGKYFQVTHDGQIYAPGFSVVNGVLSISQANVINTLNIAGNAVTVSNSAAGSSIASTNITVPAGQTMKILCVCGSDSVPTGGSIQAGKTLSLNLNGVETTDILGWYSTGGDRYVIASGTKVGHIVVTGPTTVTATVTHNYLGVVSIGLYGTLR